MLTLPVEPSRFAVFLTVMASLAAAPGPANLFSIATGMNRGPRAVGLAVVGMNSATLVWFVAAAVGLGALIRALPDVFAFLTVAGALYLIWLGLRALSAAVRGGGAISAGPTSDGSPLAQGFAVQIANPKAVLFFSAVLPPFIDLSRPLVPQLVAFAAATIGLDILTMSAYGLGGVALAQRMDAPGFRRLFNTFVGLVLIAAAVLILTRHG
jgi:threonine/homoserine/homoserine lactone efflux protein